MLKLHFEIATLNDYQRILEFLRKEFYPDETITLAHPIPGVTRDDEAFSMSHLENGVVLMAFPSKEELDGIVGVLIAGPITEICEDTLNSEKVETRKWADIVKLLTFIEEKADVCQRFQVTRSLHIHVVAVHKQFRGNQIGRKLFQKCFEVAEKLLFQLISVDCTSSYSSKVAEQLEMEFVSEVTYDEFHKYTKEIIFKPDPSHSNIKTFIKKLNNEF